MPSQLARPNVHELVAAFHRTVKAKRDARADGHTGSAYDYIAGVSGILLARESMFIRDCFREIYFSEAEGDALTNYVAQRYQIDRALDTFGTGTATIARPSSAAGGDTIFEGTRIKVQVSATEAHFYAVAADTPVRASALYVAGLPIRATFTGTGAAIKASGGEPPCTFEDPIWDPSWAVTSLQCADGTDYEKASDFRARTAATLLANLPGSTLAIQNACFAAGAANVQVFGTNFGGTDLHAAAVYVGDPSFNATTSLVRACELALEGVRMLGVEGPMPGPMAPAPLSIAATVQLYDDPSKFELATLSTALANAIGGMFGPTGAYGYDIDALFGAAVEVSDAIQDVTFTSPSSSVGLLVGSPPWFPQTLTRYQIPPNGMTFSFVGPS